MKYLLLSLKKLCMSVMLMVSVTQAAVYEVTSAEDSGPDTLRQAIIDANALAGYDEIHFNIMEGDCDAAGVCRINIASTLPYISDALLIDGTTQPQYGSAPNNVCATENDPSYMRVEVNNTAGTSERSLVLRSTEPTTIKGLSMGGNGVVDFELGKGDGHWLNCNHIGVNAEGNNNSGSSTGICINCINTGGGSAASGIIGTNGDGMDDVSERNVISGNGVNHNAGNGFIFAGNYFNLTADGLTGISGGFSCLYMRQTMRNNRIGSDLNGQSDELERNTFGQCSTAIYIAPFNNNPRNVIAGNWIGVNAIGQNVNLNTGIRIFSPGGFSDNIELLIMNNWIEGATTAFDISGSDIILTQSSGNCMNNSTTGVVYSGDADLVFENNWWGDGSGPSGDGAGSGAALTQTGLGIIDYAPWLTESNTECEQVAGDVTFRVGVTVNNLASGETVVIQNNGSFLGVDMDGFVNFKAPYINTTDYNVSVFSQPNNQTCTVTDGSGVINFADVSDVVIDCNTAPTVLANNYVVDEDTTLVADDVSGTGDTNDDSVLLNDLDPETDTLQVLTVGTFTAGGIGGDITMAADGTFTYTPGANAFGQATFDFEVFDGLNTVSSSLTIDVQSVNDAPTFSVLGDVDATDLVDSLDTVLDIPGYAYDLVLGPPNESSQQVLQFNAAILSDTDMVLNSAGISNDGNLTLDFTLNYGVALLELTLQDDGGNISGEDTSAPVAMLVAYTDVIFQDGFDQISTQAIEKLINELQISSPYAAYPIYDSVNHVISFNGHNLHLSVQVLSNESIFIVKSWLVEVLKLENPYDDTDGDYIENRVDDYPFKFNQQ